MSLDKHDKIAIGGFALVLAALYFWSTNSGASPLDLGELFQPVNLPQQSTNIPAWLQNNFTPIGSTYLPLPSLTDNSNVCQTCSLFPSPATNALGFNTL